MKIFISSPYGKRKGLPQAEIEANVAAAIEAGKELARRGHSPFVPHLYHYLVTGEISEDRWLEITLEWLSVSDAILMIGDWVTSEGARQELQYATTHGKQIFYRLEDMPNG